MSHLGIIKSLPCKLFFIIFLSFVFSFYSQQIFSLETDLENLRAFNPDLTRAYDKIKIREAWTAIKESGIHLSPVRIGIVDTGVDPNHPEFQGLNWGAIKREDLRDFEPDGHGTQVTGIIGANNLSEKQVLKPDSPQMNGILSGVLGTGDYVFEIIWTTDFTPLNQLLENVQVVNMSIGAPLCSASPIRSKISEILLGKSCYTEEEFLEDVKKYTDLIKSHPEVIFVVAAGNENIDVGFTMPAGLEFSNVIVVGATDLDDQRAWWGLPFLQASNFGDGVDIAAPGEKIYAPKPGDGYDKDFNGTSAAAPLVTGVVGLMLSLNPNLKPKEIRDILIETGDPITTDKPLGGKRLNALNAVTKVIQQIQSPKIIVEGADNVREIAIEAPPSELIDAASSATPRIIIEYADSISSISLVRPSFIPVLPETKTIVKAKLERGRVTLKQNIRVGIKIEEVIGLAAFQLDLRFNPKIMEVKEVLEGTFLKSEGGQTFWQEPVIDKANGVASIICARITPGGVNGDGLLAEVIFEPKEVGESSIEFQNLKLSDSKTKEISVKKMISAKVVIIEPYPEWDVNQDGKVDIFDLVVIGQNFEGTGDGDVNGDGKVDILDLACIFTPCRLASFLQREKWSL